MADDLEAPTDDAPLSLRDTLSEAFAADADSSGDGVQAPSTPPAAKAPDAPAKPAEPAADGRVRAPDGKFAKASEQGQSSPELKSQVGAEAAKPPISPPASWSATAKADFAKLAPHIQQEVLKREGEMAAGNAQWQSKGEKLNALEQALAPRREAYTIRGIDDVQRIKVLLAAEELLDRDPVNGLATLARQYGVDLRRFGAIGQGQAAQPPMDPNLQRLMQEVNSLKGTLTQQQQHAQQAAQAQYVSEVNAFRTDPKNIYFDNVRDDVIAMLETGRAATLQEAYDRAVWANPETRTLVAQAAEDQRRTEAEQAARAKAQAARHASGSITGSPTPGSSPASGGPAPSLREELARNFASAS